MATISYISPKSFLVKVSEIFQQNKLKAWAMPSQNTMPETAEETETTEIPQNGYFWGRAINDMPKPEPKPKLNVSMGDLKVISTALLHYRKELAKKGLFEKADEVGEIDKRFYDLILSLEEKSNLTKTNTQEIEK